MKKDRIEDGMDITCTHRYEKKKLKPCQYPDCQKWFTGTGFSKYCTEHRKREYRKFIDKLNKKEIIKEDFNQIYNHELQKPELITFLCPLCNIQFQVKIYPNIFVYPKYCDNHRNEYKRKLWTEFHSEKINIQESIIINDELNVELKETITIESEITQAKDTFSDYFDEMEISDLEVQ